MLQRLQYRLQRNNRAYTKSLAIRPTCLRKPKKTCNLEVATQWKEMHKDNLPFRTAVDARQLTDNRPETSSERRHWACEKSKDASLEMKPLTGEAERRGLVS